MSRALCLSSSLLFVTGSALASQGGDSVVMVGPAYLRSLQTSTHVVTRVTPSPGSAALGIPETFESPGVGVTPRPVATLAFSLTRFLADRFAVELGLGVPPEVEGAGHGIAAPPGPSGPLFRLDLSDPALNPLATQRQWSPVLLGRYYLRAPAARLRPFVSVGFTYTWFTQVELNPTFERALDERFGQFLATAAGKPGPTHYRLETSPLWAPVAAAGVGYAVGQRWGITASLACAPLRMKSRLTMLASDDSTLAISDATVRVRGLIAGAGLEYRFGAGTKTPASSAR